MSSAKSHAIQIVKPRFQFLCMAITLVSLALIMYTPVTKFRTADVYPPIISLSPQKVLDFGGNPVEVTVGMYIRDFPEFDIVKGNFVVDLTVWFRFDPRLLSLDRLEKFSFERAEVLSREKPFTRLMGDDLFVRYDMRVKFNMSLNYKDFPLDDHRLSFVLAHNFLSPADMLFKASRSNLVISPEIIISDWTYQDRTVKTGFSEEVLDRHDKTQNIYHPRTIFSIEYERAGIRHIISIFLPLLLIFFVGIFTFSLVANTITLSVTSITALIAYRFVIENMSPNAGYFMLSDYLFLLILVACCIIFFVNILEWRVSAFFKGLIMVLLHASIILTFGYLIVFWA